ncbi:hypothetical protein [Pyrodictium abyssi]|uniref:Uncharacterized protein n=1 Tax=Pyrodictium abyssi TaxID=54256 RepID=A0ABM8IX47_9CREN|nr:hypothetical protein PABY_07430 [Pyrodictium abyssi]
MSLFQSSPGGAVDAPYEDASLISEELRLLLRRRAPGMIVVLNTYSRRMYGVEYHVLLARSPASAYRVLEKAYRGRAPSAARELLARPLMEALRRTSVSEDEIIECAARGDDIGVFIALGLAEDTGLEGRDNGGGAFKEAASAALACSIRIEEIAARIYNRIAEKLEGPLADALAPALDYIANSSRVHSSVLSSVASALGISVGKCPDDDKGLLAELEALYRQLSSRDSISLEDALAVFRKLAAVERSINEEEYVKLLIPLLGNMLEGRMLRLYHSLLESIIRDEENHERIAKMVYSLLAEGVKR